MPEGAMKKLLEIDKEAWREELKDHKKFFEIFGSSLPRRIMDEHESLKKRLR